MKIIIGLLLLLAIGLGVRVYMSRPSEDALRPDEHVEIRDLRDPLPGNAYLACPPDYCHASGAPSPVFPLPVARLAELWTQMMAEQPNVVMVAAQPDRNRLVVIQHTSVLRFPDIITVEFVALAPDKSSVAVYSKSRYGRGDFGTNRRRVQAWLDRLEMLASAVAPSQ